ncbi:MAG TPA: ATP-binding protein, partial [Thermomicrobiales bacterium]|nr:ATP-binding protein [Thermomicrobiales bacterium]
AKSGILIVDVTTPDQPIIDVNAAFEQLTGYSRTEAIGRNCRFLQGPGTDVEATRQIREAIDHRREATVTLLNYRRDGDPFWNELHVSPLRDEDGVVRHFVGLQTDVTRGRRAVKRAEVLAQASMVLGSSLDYAKTVEGVARLTVPEIADWCAVDLLEDDASIRRLVSVYHDAENPDDAWDVQERHLLPSDSPDGPAAVIRDGEPELIVYLPDEPRSAESEHRVYLKQQRLVSAMTVPMMTRGRTIGALTLATGGSGRRYGPEDLALAQDLGSRAALAIDNARLFAAAQAAIRTRDQFLSTAAHELRTPVASIKGYAQLLLRAQQRDTLTPERMRRSLDTIDQATDRLAVLTNDLLDVSRIRLGQLPLRIRRLEFSALVQDLIQRHVETFGTTHPISLVLSDESCWVDVDPDRIQQVLTNLIDNAVKHSAEAEAIEVTIAHGESRIECEIRDSGIGLSPGAAGGLFEPFARTPNAINLNVPGLGLGLYICRGIIERHGGEIWVESAGEGLGAKFGFWLPCHPDPASEP